MANNIVNNIANIILNNIVNNKKNVILQRYAVIYNMVVVVLTVDMI